MDIPPGDFKASHGWHRRYMNWYQLFISHQTTLRQKLPAEYEDQIVVKLHRFVNVLSREHAYNLSEIGNSDETAVWFDAS